MKWKNGLNNWRKERNITKPSGKFVHMIEEELKEYVEAIKANDEHERIDALNDIMVLTANEIALNGYDHDLTMKETVREISSRKQDPEQASRDWSDEKWQKDKNQDPATLYKADYSTCKLKV